MRYRWFMAAALLLSIPLIGRSAPAPAGAKSGGPPVVFQLAPVEKLLADVDKIVRIVGGDAIGEMVQQQIKTHLGEKGIVGLDAKKPIAGCLFTINQALNTPEDFKDISGIVAIPVTNEAEFKDYLIHLFADDPLTFKPVEGKKGLYSLETNDGPPPVPVRARFHQNYLHIGFNIKDEQLDVDALVPIASMVKADETSLLLVRSFPDRIPEEIAKNQNVQLEQQVENLKKIGGNATWMSGFFQSYIEFIKRMTAQTKQSEESGFRIVFDEQASEIAFDAYAIPKKGSAYAKEIADTKPTTHAFANLVGDKAAFGLLAQLPTGTPEFRDMIQKAIDAGQQQKDTAPEFARPMIEELLKGLSRTIKGNGIQFASSVEAAKADGQFVGVMALAFDDASGLEKALKEAIKHKEFPEEAKAAFTFDVEKIDGLNVHKIASKDAPEPIAMMFGTADLHVVFGPKGIYAAVGTDAIPALKAALAAKPAPAKLFDLAANPKRLGDLITAANPGFGGIAKGVFGNEDKRISALYVSYEGGTKLNLRMGMNLKLLPKAMIGMAGVR